MKKKETLIHHYAVLIVLALVAVLSIGLLMFGSAATVGSTYSDVNGTYQLTGETENPGGGTFSYSNSYGTANLIVFKQATSFVVWADPTVNDSDANIIAAVEALGSSFANMDYWAVTTALSFNMYDVLLAANPSATLNDNALDVDITVNTAAQTFAISKGISHYSLFKFTPNTASLIVDKDVTGTNASAAEAFSVTVTFTGINLGGITNDASLTGTGGVYTFTLSGGGTPVTFSNIPYGTSYTVTESISGAQATAGWSYTSGAVTAPVVLSGGDTSDMVTILNTFSPMASLVVDKDVLGTNAPTAEDFSITVTFTGASLGGIASSAGPNAPDGVYTLMLSGSDPSVTFSNIPYGTSYTVTETVSGAQTAAGWAYTSGEVDAAVVLDDSNTSDTVTILNTYTEPTASLVIDKSVTGANAPTEEKFSVTVTFTGSGNLGAITNSAGLTGTGGVYTFLLSSADTPVTFSSIPYGTSYTVTETISGAQTSASWTYTTGAVTEPVILDSVNSSDTVEIVNNFGPTASLVVDKNVTGLHASSAEKFSITVTFAGTGLGDISNNGGLQVAGDGVYTLLLSGSDSPVTFSNIPYGTTYTVTETVSVAQTGLGWAYTSGAVEEAVALNAQNPTGSVALLNTYTPTATLKVDKSVAGINASTSEAFSITVTFSGEILDGINYSGGPNNPTGVYTFNLSAGAAPVEFTKIPLGTTYTVTETVSGDQSTAGWAYTSGQVGEAAALNSETPVTVEILNTFTPTATLTVDKDVTGENPSTTEEFSITVTFTGDNLGGIVSSAGPNMPSGVYALMLSGSDTPVTFSNIPYGTSYTVTESISGQQAADGWTNTAGTNSQAIPLNLDNPADTVTVVNNDGPTASLIVDKNVTGTGASESEEFSMTVTFTGTNTGVITNNSGLSGTGGVYTFTLSGSDTPVIFSNIPFGTQYTVNESISDAQANLGWAYSSGKVTEPAVLDVENTFSTVTIVNNYTPQTPPTPPLPPVIENGSLTVAKNISGIGASASEEFAITVQFTGTFGGITNNAGLIGTGGVYTLSLVDGESVTFTGIPFGTTYTVTESLTAAQVTNGWSGPSVTSGTISNAALIDVTVENVFNGTGVAGDSDTDTGAVAGDTDVLPQTGGMSLSTLLGLMGLALAASGGIVLFIFRKHRVHRLD